MKNQIDVNEKISKVFPSLGESKNGYSPPTTQDLNDPTPTSKKAPKNKGSLGYGGI